MRYCLVDPQGNFGSIDGDPPAAMRYTEARMAAPTMEMLEDIKHDTVDFVPNYDETRSEPTVLPCKFPNLLVNGSTGIAVGMATNIPPHNISEICDALLLVIEDPDCGFKDIIKYLQGPDFPTGGIICGKKGIMNAYTTGRGHLTVRAVNGIETKKEAAHKCRHLFAIARDESPETITSSACLCEGRQPRSNLLVTAGDCHASLAMTPSFCRCEADEASRSNLGGEQ